MKTLKIETLEKGWHDSDELILHSVFQILTDFVEKEKPFEKIDWNYNDMHKFAAKEIKSLYDWWKNKRPKRVDPLDLIKEEESPSIEIDEKGYFIPFDRKKYKKWHKACIKSEELEIKWSKEDKENIKRVVDIMSYMWT